MSDQQLESGRLFVVSAPSGAGKTSLVDALVQRTGMVGVAVSHTTRVQRPEEIDGVNYHFTDKASFESMVREGDFLESAEVFGSLYGTSRAAADKILDDGKHLVLEIDWQGAKQIRETVENVHSIFILPPSLEALRNRLERRGQDDAATVDKRMAAAFEELSHYQEFDYLIVNDNFDDALAQMREILDGRGAEYLKTVQLPGLQGLIGDLLPQKVP